MFCRVLSKNKKWSFEIKKLLMQTIFGITSRSFCLVSISTEYEPLMQQSRVGQYFNISQYREIRSCNNGMEDIVQVINNACAIYILQNITKYCSGIL